MESCWKRFLEFLLLFLLADDIAASAITMLGPEPSLKLEVQDGGVGDACITLSNLISCKTAFHGSSLAKIISTSASSLETEFGTGAKWSLVLAAAFSHRCERALSLCECTRESLLAQMPSLAEEAVEKLQAVAAVSEDHIRRRHDALNLDFMKYLRAERGSRHALGKSEMAPRLAALWEGMAHNAWEGDAMASASALLCCGGHRRDVDTLKVASCSGDGVEAFPGVAIALDCARVVGPGSCHLGQIEGYRHAWRFVFVTRDWLDPMERELSQSSEDLFELCWRKGANGIVVSGFASQAGEEKAAEAGILMLSCVGEAACTQLAKACLVTPISRLELLKEGHVSRRLVMLSFIQDVWDFDSFAPPGAIGTGSSLLLCEVAIRDEEQLACPATIIIRGATQAGLDRREAQIGATLARLDLALTRREVLMGGGEAELSLSRALEGKSKRFDPVLDTNSTGTDDPELAEARRTVALASDAGKQAGSSALAGALRDVLAGILVNLGESAQDASSRLASGAVVAPVAEARDQLSGCVLEAPQAREAGLRIALSLASAFLAAHRCDL